jgi:nitrite reductase (NADH) small subunit
MSSMTKTKHWVEIGPLKDIAPLGARIIRHVDGDIAVFRTQDDKVFALDNKCPHKGGPLSDGIVHGCRITCPLHNWVLELETGLAVAPDEGKAKTWPARVEDGMVYVELDDDVVMVEG